MKGRAGQGGAAVFRWSLTRNDQSDHTKERRMEVVYDDIAGKGV
jgi:hypothetical protein